MPTPVWQPGTIYAPGSLVRPASTPAAQPDQVTNGGFEAGNTGWTLDSGFSIGEFGNGTHFQGTWSLQWDLGGNGYAINNNATEVTAGQTINASCQVQQGASGSGDAGARCEVFWYDASNDFISSSAGNLVSSTSNQNWKQSSVAAVAPAGAAFARFAVWAFRTSGSAELWVDNCTWDAVVEGLTTGLVFRAVQAVAGYSGATEPVWPLENGLQVVDNEVTWEAVFASRVVWEAAPVLVSGEYEPEWPTAPDGEVADGTIRWVAMNWRVTDPKCPQGPVVAIGASKIFNFDDDIVAFSATTNALDWSSEADAGFLPFGLQTYGGNPGTMLGLYRSNLLAFNAQGYQMWQIDEDPANMAFLDASPVPCTFYKSGQPVSNDFALVTPVGVRSIGIAGASTNLQAGYFGAQIDPLVAEKLTAGEVPISLTWPAAGQYWVIFGEEVFVLTMNGSVKDWSWSRYVFPYAITDWTILDDDLYLRATGIPEGEGTVDVVWAMDAEELEDDVHVGDTGPLCNGDDWADFEESSPPPAFIAEQGYWMFDTSQTNEQRKITYGGSTPLPDTLPFRWTIFSDPDEGTTIYFYTRISGVSTWTPLVGTSGTIEVDTTGSLPFYWGFTTEDQSTTMILSSGGVIVECGTDLEGTPFEGYMAWPYLDFGLLGMDKELEGFDVAADGTFRVSVGWSQKNFALATPDYALDGDTLTGDLVPLPLTAPSFQFRLTFDASQAWEWQASAIYML